MSAEVHGTARVMPDLVMVNNPLVEDEVSGTLPTTTWSSLAFGLDAFRSSHGAPYVPSPRGFDELGRDSNPSLLASVPVLSATVMPPVDNSKWCEPLVMAIPSGYGSFAALECRQRYIPICMVGEPLVLLTVKVPAAGLIFPVTHCEARLEVCDETRSAFRATLAFAEGLAFAEFHGSDDKTNSGPVTIGPDGIDAKPIEETSEPEISAMLIV